MSVSSASWIITSTGCTPARGGDVGDRRVRRHRRVEHPHAVELRRAGLPAERLAVRALVGDLHQPGHDVGVVGAGAAAPRPGKARSSRHSGSRSKGSWVRNDEKAPMPRGWVTPHIRAPASASCRRGVASAWRRSSPRGHDGDAGREREVAACGPCRVTSGGAGSLDDLEVARRRARRAPRRAAHTSSHDASRDATGRSSDVWWCTVRDVVNPYAPACSASAELGLHRGEVVVGGLAPRRPASPMTYVRSAEWPMLAA